MPRNIEIKARVATHDNVRRIAAALGARRADLLRQVDRYYEIDGGRRVKLRTFDDRPAELIHYSRPEDEGVRPSDYSVTPVDDAEAGACLVPRGAPLVVVRKERELWLLDNVRIHLDQVEDLGTFVELEAVVDESHDDDACRAQVDRLVEAFGLRERDLLRASYSDLLLRR
jgi:predicted adenylyl cyclase CyaB